MPEMVPDIGATALSLLREARYGFERDDTDGYNYARQCVALAEQKLGAPAHVELHPRDHQLEVIMAYLTLSLEQLRQACQAIDPNNTGKDEEALEIVTSASDYVAIAKGLLQARYA